MGKSFNFVGCNNCEVNCWVRIRNRDWSCSFYEWNKTTITKLNAGVGSLIDPSCNFVTCNCNFKPLTCYRSQCLLHKLTTFQFCFNCFFLFGHSNLYYGRIWHCTIYTRSFHRIALVISDSLFLQKKYWYTSITFILNYKELRISHSPFRNSL